VRAEETLTAFLELEKVTRDSLRFQNADNKSQSARDCYIFVTEETDY
jgi:hypothetical protein